MADAICGAMWNASLHADEFAYEFGEDIVNALDVAEETYIDN